MTFEEASKYIEPIRFVNPGPKATEAIDLIMKKNLSGTPRRMNLSDLKKTEDKCVWCNDGELKKRQQKYCSDDCRHSAWMFSNPQSDTVRSWVLINKQNCACTVCGVSYEDYFVEKIKKKVERYERYIANGSKPDWEYVYGHITDPNLNYFQLGYGFGSVVHIDHIVPIFKGGAGIGLDNIQVICVGCHHQKTASERR